jgi:hypothetical protein
VLYRISVTPVNTTIRGITLARRPISPIERAFIAANIFLGRLIVEDPTITQAVAVSRANVDYTRAALRADPVDRAAIIAGDKPLMKPSSQTLERAIRAAGVNAAWAVIEKLI